MLTGRIRTFAAALALAGLVSSPVIADQVLDQAKNSLAQRRPNEAYDLLRPLEAKRAGEIEYDYLLGVAARDAGDAQSAIFALERVLAVNPNYRQARTEVARTYLALGEKANPDRTVRAAQEQRRPDPTRQTIGRYLSALAPQTTRLRAYLEAAAGWDSNVKTATPRSTIALPDFGGAIGQLDANGQRQSSWFGGLGAGASIDQRIGDEWSLLGAASYTGKFNQDFHQFDAGTLDGSAGVRWARGANQLVGLVQGQMFWLDNDRYRNLYGGTAQWLHDLSPTQQFGLFGQYSVLRYPQPSQSPRDANRAVGGVAYAQAFEARYSPVAYASGYVGHERTIEPEFSYLEHALFGVRLGGQASLTAQAVLFGAAAYERRNYFDPNPAVLVKREDNQFDFQLGLAYMFLPQWTLTPQVGYTKNDSNIELNEYDRTLATVTVRKDF